MDFSILDRLQYRCATIGSNDIEQGFQALLQKISATDVPVVCANLYDKVTRRPLLPRYTVIDVPGGLRIGFTGLLGEKARQRLPQDVRRRVNVSDVTAAFNEVRKLIKKAGADMTVILADMTVVEFFHLHEQLGDYIDLVLGLKEESIVTPLAWREDRTVVAHAPRGPEEVVKLNLVFRPGGVLSFTLEALEVGSPMQEAPDIISYLAPRENKAARWMAEILYPEVLTRRLDILHRIKTPEDSAVFTAEALRHHANSWSGLTIPTLFRPGLPPPDIPLRRGDIYSLFVQPERAAVLSLSVAWEARERFLTILSGYPLSPAEPELKHPYPENRPWEQVTIALPESLIQELKTKLNGDPFIKDIDVQFCSFHDVREVVTFYISEALDHKTPAKRGARPWK